MVQVLSSSITPPALPSVLNVFNGFFGQQLFDLTIVDPERLQRGLHDVVEDKSEVDQQGKAKDLEPLERFPAQAQRHDPDEESPAGVDGRSRGGAHATGHRETKKVEAATRESVSISSARVPQVARLTRC